MTFLVFAIVASTMNHLLFKAFSRFGIDLLSAIVVNYFVCVIIGYGTSSASVLPGSIFTQNWYPYSLVQGGLFAACFFLIGRTTEKQGVAVASLATRLSVAVPTFAAFLMYDDVISAPKIVGILIALTALYLSSAMPSQSAQPPGAKTLLPLILFAAFGVHSTLIKFVQANYLGNTSYHAYVMAAFFSAFMLSGSVLAWRFLKKKQSFHWKDLVSGIALGCANYGAVYFLIRVLGVPGWQSSRIFPTLSVSIVLLSSFGAWAFFNERYQRRMVAALAAGVGAIVLVNL